MWTRQCFLVYSESFNCSYNPISEHFNPPRSLLLIGNHFSALHCVFLSPPCPRQTTNLFSVSISLVTQSGPTLCGPMDCGPPGSSVHGILQAKILEWGSIPFSRGSSRPRDGTWVSCMAGGFFTIWATREAPGFLSSGHLLWMESYNSVCSLLWLASFTCCNVIEVQPRCNLYLCLLAFRCWIIFCHTDRPHFVYPLIS